MNTNKNVSADNVQNKLKEITLKEHSKKEKQKQSEKNGKAGEEKSDQGKISTRPGWAALCSVPL